MLNNVFQSPYYDPVSAADDQFRARDAWQLLTYPFYWIKTNSYLVTERPLRDWRGALAYLAILAALVPHLVGLARAAPHRGVAGETCGLGLVGIFVVISYLVWAAASGNYRYGVTLEMLTGVVIIGVAMTLVREPVARIGVAAFALAVVTATTVYPDWGRGRYGDRYVDVRVPPLPANSVVLIATGQPVAFFIPFAEPTAQFLGIENDFLGLSQHNLLVSKVAALMRAPGRPKFVVSVGDFNAEALNRLLARFGLTLGNAPCRPIRSNLENPSLSLCTAVPR